MSEQQAVVSATEAATLDSKLTKMIREQLGCREDEIQATSSFVDDLGADSLDMVEMCMATEEVYDIEIMDEDFEKVVTVQDLADLIGRITTGNR